MYVVLRGITIWTLCAALSFVCTACLSTVDRLKWELMFDPMPDEPFQRYANHMNKRLHRGDTGGALEDAITTELQQSSSVVVTMCNCTQNNDPVTLDERKFYPSVLPAVSCYEDHWCRKTEYPVPVLMRKPTSDMMNIWEPLPADLSLLNWQYVEIKVTVACICL